MFRNQSPYVSQKYHVWETLLVKLYRKRPYLAEIVIIEPHAGPVSAESEPTYAREKVNISCRGCRVICRASFVSPLFIPPAAGPTLAMTGLQKGAKKSTTPRRHEGRLLRLLLELCPEREFFRRELHRWFPTIPSYFAIPPHYDASIRVIPGLKTKGILPHFPLRCLIRRRSPSSAYIPSSPRRRSSCRFRSSSRPATW